MGYGDDGGGSWMMWGFGALLMIGVLVLIGVAAWAIITATGRAHAGPAAADPATADAGGRSRTRQILDERYARGELTTDEYTERVHNLAL